jgi:hypothetical protein
MPLFLKLLKEIVPSERARLGSISVEGEVGVLVKGQRFVEWEVLVKLVETSIRFSPGTMEQLKRIAHLRSLETGKTVTWNEIVRELVERHLLGVADGPGREQP